MDSKVRWLRISYWVGAIADAFFFVAMVYPPLLLFTLRIPDTQAAVETRSALAMGAALMAGWTVLLLWANARPMERKGILMITVFPGIAGLALATLYGFMAGYIPLAGAAPVWLFLLMLASLMLFSYFHASGADPAR